MKICCEHKPEEHHVVELCHQVIHYPSEDYMCVCEGLVAGGNVCASCGHSAGDHGRERICRPNDGAFCPCRSS